MKDIESMINENLPGLWNEVRTAFQDDRNGAEDIIYTYRTVIKEMIKNYALEVVSEIETGLCYWSEGGFDQETFNDLKQKIENE